jgi:predicted anti-sigma-YlaC factor YlaD
MSTGEHPAGCRAARAWLSASRDGEALHDEQAAAHLHACQACVAWAAALDELTGRLRLRPAVPLDLVGPALAAWREQAGRRRDRRAAVGRALLGAAGTLGLLLAASRLVGMPPLSPRISAHAGRELAAFEAALAVGFLLAAWRPRRHGGGLLGVALTVAALILAGAVADLLAGRSQFGGEVAHLPVVVGVVGLLLALPVRHQPAAAPSGSAGGQGQHPPPTPATG